LGNGSPVFHPMTNSSLHPILLRHMSLLYCLTNCVELSTSRYPV